MNDIEKVFDVFVQEFGGTFVRDLIGSSPPFDNADYLFEKYHVIAELKCLEDNKLGDAKFLKKVSSIYLDALQKGGTRKIVFGTIRLTSEDFTPEYQKRLFKLYEQPVQNRIKKANKQIRYTRKHLGKDTYKGVLILINTGNLALDPVHVVQLLDRIFSRGLYSSIDYTIFLTVNLTAKHPSRDVEHMVWVSLYKKLVGNEIFNKFEAALRKSWQKHLEYNLGVQIPFQTAEEDFFHLLENRKDGI